MALPKQRTSTQRRGQRRAGHKKIATVYLTSCPKCHAPKPPHRVCPNCGFYKERYFLADEKKR